MDLFVNCAGLDRSVTRILDPKLRNAAKAAVLRFQADELIRSRQAAVNAFMEGSALESEASP